MCQKYLWAIILAMQLMFAFNADGQNKERGSILFNDSVNIENSLTPVHLQPLLQNMPPKLFFQEFDFNSSPFYQKKEIFHFENSFKNGVSYKYTPELDPVPSYPGLGDYRSFGGTIGEIKFNSRSAIEFGAFMGIQSGSLLSSREVILGSNLLLRYRIFNKLEYLLWGQYITPGNSTDPIFDMHTFFPQTNFGSGLQYGTGEKTKIRVGVEYQYDPSDKTWKAESGGKVLLKF